MPIEEVTQIVHEHPEWTDLNIEHTFHIVSSNLKRPVAILESQLRLVLKEDCLSTND